MFEESRENKGERVCSSCEESKPVSEFYKDGTNSEGEPRYRRDCKECYRVTRLKSRQAKRAPVKVRRK